MLGTVRYAKVPKEEAVSSTRRFWWLLPGLLGVGLLLLSWAASRGEDDASEPGSPEPTSLRQLTLYDPCYIKGPCYKGVLWFPGSEFRGPGWYCKDRLDLKKEDALDPCHIAAPCFFGAVWAGKEWQCGAEDPSKVKGRYEDLMRKLLKGPTRDDKIWAIKELYDELPSPATICPKRGYQAPKKCRMIGMGHGKMMLGLNSSTVLFDLVVCEDPEMRGRASGVLYNMVSESQANLPRLINKMGGLKQLVLNFNPETNASQKDRWKAQFGLNMLTSECKARAPDMCDFFPELVHMSSTGLQDLVWHPPIGTGYQLQVALQEAWVSSCTVKNGVPRKEDFEVGNIQRFQSPEPSPKKLDVGVAQIAHPLPPGSPKGMDRGSDPQRWMRVSGDWTTEKEIRRKFAVGMDGLSIHITRFTEYGTGR